MYYLAFIFHVHAYPDNLHYVLGGGGGVESFRFLTEIRKQIGCTSYLYSTYLKSIEGKVYLRYFYRKVSTNLSQEQPVCKQTLI